MELRCDAKLHALVVDGLIEVKCPSRFCRQSPDEVVLHRFTPEGELVTTLRFRGPQKGSTHG